MRERQSTRFKGNSQYIFSLRVALPTSHDFNRGVNYIFAFPRLKPWAVVMAISEGLIAKAADGTTVTFPTEIITFD